jgi:phosphatidate cytidylyltransferase
LARELAHRVAVAVVGIPVVVACLALGGWVLGVLIAAFAAVGAWELYRLARGRGERPFAWIGASASAGLVLLAVTESAGGFAGRAFWLVLGLTLVLLALSVWLRWPGGNPLSAVSSTVLGVVYVGGGLAFVPLLRSAGTSLHGAGAGRALAMSLVLLPLVVTWVGDSAAYFVGRGLGRHKLAPHASPGKTVEGALAGLAGSALAGAAVAAWAWADLPGVASPPLTGAWIGAVLGAVGQVGDLAESVLKREAGVKDSGRLLPGHGGVLDRVDALLLAFPTTWLLLVIVGVLP